MNGNSASLLDKHIISSKKGILEVFKQYYFHFISKETSNNFQISDIDNNIKCSKALIINDYKYDDSNKCFFFIGFKNTIIIINQSLMAILSQIIFIKPDLPLYFISENAKNSLCEKIKVSENRVIYDITFSELVQNFESYINFSRNLDPEFQLIKQSIPCLLGYLIKEAYEKSNQKQNEIFNQIKNEISMQENDLTNEIFEEDDYVELRTIGNGSLFFIELIYHIIKAELFVIKKTKTIDILEVSKLIKRERYNYTNIKYPFIPKLYGTINNNENLVIQFINGSTLERIQDLHLDFNTKISIIYQIILFINYISKYNFVYRDLKPDNIMIDKNNAIFIIDFDRMIKNSDETKKDDDLSGENEFTHDFNSDFIAPEVNKGQTTYKSDIYSIGKIIYFIINEKIPNNFNSKIECFEHNKELQHIYDICTYKDISNRPTISNLLYQFYSCFLSIIDNSICHCFNDLNIPNDSEDQFKLGLMYFEGKQVKQDINKAIYYYTLAAKQNHPSAQNNLGLIYYTGKYVKQDINQAIHFYTLAANQKNSKALYNLGKLYYEGIYTDRNINKAINYFTLASQQDVPYAQYALGVIYLEGKYLKRDIHKAIHFLSLASNNKIVDAHLKLGNIYYNGEYITRDINKAIHHFTIAADQNDLESQFNLGIIYSDDQYNKRDIKKSVYYLTQAANQNFLEAQFNLGILYFDEMFGFRDINKSLYYFELAANQNHLKACLFLGFFFHEGKYITKDINKSIYYYKLAANQNHPHAQYCLGMIFFNYKDIKKAIHYFTLAANHNHQFAQSNLGFIYYEGKFIKKDINKSIYYFSQAAKQNNIQAQYFLGLIYYEGISITRDIDKSIYFLSLAAKQNFLPAQYNLGVIYEEGKYINKDIKKSIEYYTQAADQNFPQALYNLGNFYFNGKYVKIDIEKAIYYYSLAANQNFPQAQYNLGFLYLNDKFIKQDIDKSIYYLTLAAKQNVPEAQSLLGKLYLFGLNVNQNVHNGIYWLKLSSSNGCIEANFTIGYLYHEGKYVKKDIITSIKYYKEASSFNNKYAKNNLGIIYKNGIKDQIEKNIENAKMYFKEAIKRSNDLLSMYNLSHIYIYENESDENIDESIELLIKSINNHHFNQSIPLLCISLIKKYNYDLEKIQNELNNRIKTNSNLSRIIYEKIKSKKLYHKSSFIKIYHLYKAIDYIYDYNLRGIPSKQLNEEQIKSLSIDQMNITNEFYEGLGFDIYSTVQNS